MIISEFIPEGKENAVSRNQLCALTGLSDRDIRKHISQERRYTPIINDQSGNGYYIPLKKDVYDAKEALRQETSRAKSIFWSIKGLRDWIRENE